MAATNTLSDKEIRAAIKAAMASGKSRKLSDGGGLVLEARPNGAGWWRWRFWQVGREGMLSLGTYPEVSLKEARDRRDEERRGLAAGRDPSAARQASKAVRIAAAETASAIAQGRPAPGTFESVSREWLETVHDAKVSTGHASTTRRRLERDVYPWLGSRPIKAIEAPDLLQCLRRVEARGAIETSHRIKDICGQVFRYGIAAGLCDRNPAADLRDALRPVPTRHHAAIVDPKRGGELLRVMMDYRGRPETRAALELSALLLLRPGELRHLEWTWVDFPGATLTVPAEAMKRQKAGKMNGQGHVVPLAPQAVAVLAGLRALSGRGRFVFPSLLTGERCMSENTVRAALRRMGYGNDDMTAHGFRAMARTMLAEQLGIAAEVIEAQLAHAVSDSLGRAYNRTQFLEQRREMMGRWADYLDRLREGAQVTPLPGRAA